MKNNLEMNHMPKIKSSFLTITVLLIPSGLYCRVKHESMRSLMSSICVNIAFVVFLLSLEKIYGMQQQSVDTKKYIIRIQISKKTHEVNPQPMTIAYLRPVFDEEKLERVRAFVAKINQRGPFDLNFNDAVNRGTKEHPVSVRGLSFEYIFDEAAFFDLYNELKKCESGQPEKLIYPKWYVSLKDPKIREKFVRREFASHIAHFKGNASEANLYRRVVGGKLFIESLESFDPMFELE